MTASRVRVVIADDQPLVRAALGTILASDPAILGHLEAVERAISYAEGPPSEELATALIVMANCQHRVELLRPALTYIDRAVEVAAAVPVPITESAALQYRGWIQYFLGRTDAATADFAAARLCAIRGGSAAEAIWSEFHGATAMIDGVDPARGMTLAVDLRARARALGLPEVAERSGLAIAHGLISLGRLDEAELLLSELVDEGTSPDFHHWRCARTRLLALQGETAAALALERASMALFRTVAVLPEPIELLQHVEVLVASGLAHEALDIAREYAAVLRDADGPSAQGGIAAFVYAAVAGAHGAGLPDDDELLGRADDLLARAAATITEQALACWQGTFFLIARARRADLAGEPSVDAWRTAVTACARIGAGHALQPRLGLVAALLVAGERNEARTALPELWADARSVGAAGVVGEAARLARRHRIPLPEDDQRSSRLDILTAREREVLGVLVTGATNKMIAERLFISEKTVSVHVTNLMAKLGVSNRGEAAALARELAPAD